MVRKLPALKRCLAVSKRNLSAKRESILFILHPSAFILRGSPLPRQRHIASATLRRIQTNGQISRLRFTKLVLWAAGPKPNLLAGAPKTAEVVAEVLAVAGVLGRVEMVAEVLAAAGALGRVYPGRMRAAQTTIGPAKAGGANLSLHLRLTPLHRLGPKTIQRNLFPRSQNSPQHPSAVSKFRRSPLLVRKPARSSPVPPLAEVVS
jgi:hypothetical protein